MHHYVTCPLNSPAPIMEKVIHYNDGCKIQENVGAGHTYLPGCDKYNPTTGFGAPAIDTKKDETV